MRCTDEIMIWFFFFQAEDGIRDLTVTGVQTCALPIYSSNKAGPKSGSTQPCSSDNTASPPLRPIAAAPSPASAKPLRAIRAWAIVAVLPRSEERRVGKSVDLGGRRIIKKKMKRRRGNR